MLDLSLKNYVDWRVSQVIPVRSGFGYRVFLKYPDGSEKPQQKSGFKTEKEANKAREKTIAELYNGTFVVYAKVNVADYMTFWLEMDLKKRTDSHETYYNYCGIVKNHIIPILGKKKMTDVTRGDVQKLFNIKADYSRPIAELVKTIMNVSFRYAVTAKVIPASPVDGIGLPKAEKPQQKSGFRTRNINTQKTLTMEQIQILLEASKRTQIHMQVLFNVLMGLRRQEINGLKYSDVDYINRTLTVERQLGKELDRNPNASGENPMTKRELPLKSSSSKRVLPIPDYVFEAVLKERKIYEKNRSRRKSQFLDADYICCSSYGKPRSKDFHWRHYKNLLKSAGLPDIRWHDLRSTYCTLLLKSDFNPKAVSKLMGHAKELITVDVYGDDQNIIPEEMLELVSYMNDVMPKRSGQDLKDVVLDTVIETEKYLPDK